MSTNSLTPAPWVFNRGESTEVGLEAVGPGVGHRTLGESYDYTLIIRDGQSGSEIPSYVVERYNELLDRARYAGRYSLHELIDSRPEYTPKWPDNSESLLVRLEPVDGMDATVPGLWGLIESAEILQEPMHPDDTVSNVARIAYSLTYLADADEFETREEIQERLENPGLF